MYGGFVSLSLLDPPYIMANPLTINIFPLTLQNVVLFGIEIFQVADKISDIGCIAGVSPVFMGKTLMPRNTIVTYFFSFA